MKDRWNDYKNREGMHGARPSSFDPNKISKRKQHQFQNFKQKHHFTRPSVSTAVTTRSVATGAFSVDESRDDSIYVSKITSSGNKRVMYASAETSYSLNSNVIPEGGKNASLASQSTIFHDAISTDPHHHPSHDSPGQYSREARDQHCRYYSDGSIASSQYTSNSYMPQERHMTMSPSHYNDHRWQTYSPINSSNPPKHDTILEDAKPFWSRLKSIFEGEDQTCIEKGLFCNCIEATRSPTPDKFHSYYDGYQNVHNYHSFKDIAPNSVKNDKHSQCQNARTIKKNNAAKVTNDYSLVNLGTAPDHRHEKHHRIESSLYLSSVEHDFNPYDMSLNASPPKEEKSQRRLFQTPSKGWACHEDSPDSIQSEESPMVSPLIIQSCSVFYFFGYQQDMINQLLVKQLNRVAWIVDTNILQVIQILTQQIQIPFSRPITQTQIHWDRSNSKTCPSRILPTSMYLLRYRIPRTIHLN